MFYSAEEEEKKKEEAGEEPAPPIACSGECPETTVPENPDDLIEKGWEEPPSQAPNRRKFRNPTTGEEIEFDKGVPGRDGWAGRDHYHRPNPNSTGRGDGYLDQHGNPVPRGSKPSHIAPGSTLGTGGSTS